MIGKHLRKLCEDAVAEGYRLIACYDGLVDYQGHDVEVALDTLTACDEMTLRIRDAEGKQMGVAFIVNERGQDPAEQIADYGGAWMEEWWKANIGAEIE